MIALYKYSFSDYNGSVVKECKATQVGKGETVEDLFLRLKVGNLANTNERVEIFPDIEEIKEKETINF